MHLYRRHKHYQLKSCSFFFFATGSICSSFLWIWLIIYCQAASESAQITFNSFAQMGLTYQPTAYKSFTQTSIARCGQICVSMSRCKAFIYSGSFTGSSNCHILQCVDADKAEVPPTGNEVVVIYYEEDRCCEHATDNIALGRSNV